MMQADFDVPSDDPSDLHATVARLLAHPRGLANSTDPVAAIDSLTAVVAAFRRTRVYCMRPDEPGFLAIGPAGHAMVPVFSSLEALAAFDDACAWFSLPGADLLRLLPEGYDVALDLAGPHPIRLHAGLWRNPLSADPQGESRG